MFFDKGVTASTITVFTAFYNTKLKKEQSICKELAEIQKPKFLLWKKGDGKLV